jgi:hypothetical protein
MPTASPSRSSRSVHLAGGLLLGALLLAVAISPARWNSLPDVCLFHRLTHLPCPSCGLTRSWAAAVRGQFELSLRFHALGAAALVILLGGLGCMGVLGRRLKVPLWLLVGGGGLWVVYALGRMLGYFAAP